MRFVLITVLLACVGTGCARFKAKAPGGTDPIPRVKPVSAKPKSKAPSAPPPKLSVTAMNTVHGKVVLVNDLLKFVVVDFSVGRKPVPGQRLGVYRKEQKIGEVKISGQARDVNFAADQLAGEVRIGDDVRED